MNRALKKCGVPTCQLEKMDSIAELWRAMERIYIGPGGVPPTLPGFPGRQL
jgi:hypothetical protein